MNLLVLVNFEILSYFIYSHFFLDSTRLLHQMPLVPDSDTFVLIYSLLLYFLALWVFHRTRSFDANKELRFLIPFALPFLLMTAVFDILKRFPAVEQFLSSDDPWIVFFVFIMMIGFLLLIMIFLPYWLQKIWLCKSIKDTELRKRLENICERARFKYADLKTWKVLDNVLTAAILGVIPRYRYIMFSKRLLKEMPPESVEAILAHEIGHSARKHLWIYPFILFGMSVLVGWIAYFFKVSEVKNDVVIFVTYGLAIALYFRFVFGFFSRLFERQADLHVFKLQIAPQHLINALNYVGVALGNTHLKFSWHHFGIQQRIDFLKKAIAQPEVIDKHHRYVRNCVLAYLLMLVMVGALLMWVD